jgi:hypothetical protein
MKRIHASIGLEREIADNCRELRTVVRGFNPNEVGAMLIHCADEAEHEAAEVFHRTFAQDLLPRLKYGSRVPFNLANPGARYEWGSGAIAEAHFATPESRRGFKVLVTKIMGHVAVQHDGKSDFRFGVLERYGTDSPVCGAIAAVLGGADLPFVLDMAAALRSEGQDRLAALRDPARVDPVVRPLFGALLHARLQARHVVQDLQDLTALTPTLHLVKHGVTLNKPGMDTEIIGGMYLLDHRAAKRHDRYRGLGDDPAAYEWFVQDGRIGVRDPHIARERDARDHRALARERFEHLPVAEEQNEAIDDVLADVERKRAQGAVAGALAGPLLTGLALVAPVPAALVLAAEGAIAVHSLHKLHQADGIAEQRRHAREAIDVVKDRLAGMTPEAIERLVAALRETLRARRATT